MRILYVLRYYPTLSETFVLREIRELLRLGHQIEVVALGRRADGRLATNLPVVRVHRPSRRAPLWTWHHRIGPVDQIHAHFDGEASMMARRLSKALGRPYTVTVHAVDLFKPHVGIVRRLLEAESVVVVCEHHQRWLEERMGVRSVVVPCGVEIPRASADPTLEPAVVVAVARHAPKKGLDRLKRAHPDALWLHDVPHVEALQQLMKASVFALPCRVAPDGDRDGVPVAMMEAMARGLPVVTRPVAGIAELVDETCGWVSDDFEGALREALEDPLERGRRGGVARSRIRSDRSIEHTVGKLLRVWDTDVG